MRLVGGCGEDKYLLPLLGIEPEFFRCPSCNQATITATYFDVREHLKFSAQALDLC